MELRQPGQQSSSSPSSSSTSSAVAAAAYQRPPPPAGGEVLLLPPPRSCPVTVRVRRNSLAYLPSIREKLSAIFGVQLQEVLHSADEPQYQHQQQQQFVSFQVLDEASGCQVAVGSVLSGSLISSGNGDLIGQIQLTSSLSGDGGGGCQHSFDESMYAR
uniref:Uncharacterized protein n=1 Tax=Anopheles melas TaxID=34690 RepID=A0A182U3I5_9DIPT